MVMLIGALIVLAMVSYSVFYKLNQRYSNLIPVMLITGFGILALIWIFFEWGVGMVFSFEVEMKLTGIALLYTIFWPLVCKRVVERIVDSESGHQKDPSFYFEQELG